MGKGFNKKKVIYIPRKEKDDRYDWASWDSNRDKKKKESEKNRERK